MCLFNVSYPDQVPSRTYYASMFDHKKFQAVCGQNTGGLPGPSAPSPALHQLVQQPQPPQMLGMAVAHIALQPSHSLLRVFGVSGAGSGAAFVTRSASAMPGGGTWVGRPRACGGVAPLPSPHQVQGSHATHLALYDKALWCGCGVGSGSTAGWVVQACAGPGGGGWAGGLLWGGGGVAPLPSPTTC